MAIETPAPADPTQPIQSTGVTCAHREPWQTKELFEPERRLDSLLTRYQAGKSLREQTPRESHAGWTPAADRADPVATLVASNAGREESLVPLRMGRMARTPFAFLRGACAVMAGDLARTPVSGLQVLIDGDAHINNFGLYGTPQRDVVIDINDFDEATVGPWEWDLKRLVASVNVAGRDNGLDAEARRAAVLRCVGAYAANARRLMRMGVLETWSLFAYAELERNVAIKGVEVRIGRKFREIIKRTLAKARQTHNASLLEKVARRHADGHWEFVPDPPILTTVDQPTRKKVIAALAEYGETLPPAYRLMLQRYSVADVCHRVVGVGSVGLRAYLVLLFGNGDADPLFLQVKEAAAPAHAPYLPALSFRVDHEGHRVVAVQRALQSMGDPLLGHTTIDGRHYYVRQMKNRKASMPVEFLTGQPFEFWGWVCGSLLARAHARTGDIAKIAGYIGKSSVFANALAEFAEAYGDQTARDHAALVQAVQAGRVESVTETDR